MVVHRSRRDDPARLRAGDGAAVSLPRHRCAVRVGADRLAQPHAVDDDASRIVLGEDPEIERLELACADAAEPGREGDAVRTGSGPVEEVDAHWPTFGL